MSRKGPSRCPVGQHFNCKKKGPGHTEPAVVAPSASAMPSSVATPLSASSPTGGMNAAQINSMWDSYQAQDEAARLAEERRPELDRRLAAEKATRQEAFLVQRRKDQQRSLSSYLAIPEGQRPVLSQEDLVKLKKSNTRFRYVAGEGNHEEQSARVVGYIYKLESRRNPGVNVQEVVSNILNRV